MQPSPRTSSGPNHLVTPGKRRLQACERCAKRKQKCDRLLPVCTSCREANAQCESRQLSISCTAEEASGISHAAMSKKAQVLHSNGRSQRACLRAAAPVPAPPGSTSRTHDVSPESSTDSPVTNPTPATQQSVQATMGDIDFLSRNAMAEPRNETHGFPPQLGVASMVRAALEIPGGNPSHFVGLGAGQCALPAVGAASRITKEVAESCLRNLLQGSQRIYLPLDEPTLKQCVVTTFSGEVQCQIGGSSSAEFHLRIFRACMAVALGMLLSGDHDSRVFANDLHSLATEHLPAVLQSTDGLKVVECLLLLIHFSILHPRGGSTWHLIGLAMKKCIALKLHKEPQPEMNLTEAEVLERKRIFWSLYVVDRAISCVMDRPFSIEDEDITLKNPLVPKATESPGGDTQHHVLMHARLMSSICTLTSQSASFHHHNLRHWRDVALHNQGPSSQDADPTAQLTCRGFVQISKVAGTAPAPRRTIVRSDQGFEEDVANSCRQYIDQEFNSSQQGCFTGSFLDGYDLFAAGVLLVCQPNSPLGGETSFIGKCTALLTLIGERFTCFRTMCRLLWDLSGVALHGGKTLVSLWQVCGVTNTNPRVRRQLKSSQKTCQTDCTIWLTGSCRE
ncbi:hypothetical protein ASPACDRAFT_1869499 [Aspergillus aculeatus ATCC 16872]|uniref:Zn(2)-C6 fungal-type domain-containing protein n=1 Tax=Aspergillus aculeatus (strain ATCC 16872 / CBS 172.66 / WB 5094) TaxID=690307 RepID=A0A1L9WUL7_ASPA1|nr:uncharacterized protein ASPACDRAFT_1869499 [Aspergillus aculeatus ATCC 16872]OJJ99597.1 hypothetical protein ASPACDRAFT_1869499 [Aspergillus aculeatus ATCC 16872]